MATGDEMSTLHACQSMNQWP